MDTLFNPAAPTPPASELEQARLALVRVAHRLELDADANETRARAFVCMARELRTDAARIRAHLTTLGLSLELPAGGDPEPHD